MKKFMYYPVRIIEKLLLGIIIRILHIEMRYIRAIKRPIIYFRHKAESFARKKIDHRIASQKMHLETLNKQLRSI